MPRSPGRPTGPEWSRWGDARLLRLRLRELGLRVEGTILERRIRELHRELLGRGVRFRPHVWLSDEWFSPDGVPGIAAPFYLAHPRLLRLEKTMMLEAEGETRDACLRILRHETGHAIDHAYRLGARKAFRRLFGNSRTPYPSFYRPLPFTRRYVLNLDTWYAQAHPSEDFAETFAVWLEHPEPVWREQYRGWPALRKLEQVDRWMQEIGPRVPVVRSRAQADPVSRQSRTLDQYYDEKRRSLAEPRPGFHDRDLRWLFLDRPGRSAHRRAGLLLDRLRPEIRNAVANWTGQNQWNLEQVLQDMIRRCEELDLRVDRAAAEVRQEAVALLTMQTMNHLHAGRHRLV